MSNSIFYVSEDVLKNPYSLVLLGNLLITIQMLLFTYIYVLKGRKDLFRGRFYKENKIDEIH